MHYSQYYSVQRRQIRFQRENTTYSLSTSTLLIISYVDQNTMPLNLIQLLQQYLKMTWTPLIGSTSSASSFSNIHPPAPDNNIRFTSILPFPRFHYRLRIPKRTKQRKNQKASKRNRDQNLEREIRI